jgi:hypothetical protein
MGATGKETHIFINPITTGRADEWESFVRSVVMPVVASRRPEILDRVRLLRAGGQDDGSTPFAFVFEGGDMDDYDLEPLFTAEYGEEEAQRRLQEWEEMFARDQYGWAFRDVSLTD